MEGRHRPDGRKIQEFHHAGLESSACSGMASECDSMHQLQGLQPVSSLRDLTMEKKELNDFLGTQEVMLKRAKTVLEQYYGLDTENINVYSVRGNGNGTVKIWIKYKWGGSYERDSIVIPKWRMLIK